MTRLLIAQSLVFGLIALGYVLRRIHIPGDRFWPMAENLTSTYLKISERRRDKAKTGLISGVYTAVNEHFEPVFNALRLSTAILR